MSCFSVTIYPYSIFLSAGPSHIQVEGPDSQTVRGNVIELTVDHPLKSVILKCGAQNTGSRKKTTALKTVHVKGREAIKMV